MKQRGKMPTRGALALALEVKYLGFHVVGSLEVWVALFPWRIGSDAAVAMIL